jgi:DNA-binding transcriptional MerR regulator
MVSGALVERRSSTTARLGRLAPDTVSCAMVVSMYSIGAFAQLGGVTVRMLRHYDGIGLLTPAYVDPNTGRRSYEAAQLRRLNRLVALKDLGFALEQVGELLDDGIDPAELRGMLRMRAAELETRLLHDGQTLDRVRARLRLIESESAMPLTNIQVKNVAPQRVLGLQQSFSQNAEELSLEALFDQVITFMDAAGADRASPISWHDREDETVHICAGFVAATAVVPGLDVLELPAATAASVVRRGAVDTLSDAHQAIARWAEAHHHTPSVETGRWRVVYLETNDSDYSDWLIEVQLELTDGVRYSDDTPQR